MDKVDAAEGAGDHWPDTFSVLEGDLGVAADVGEDLCVAQFDEG